MRLRSRRPTPLSPLLPTPLPQPPLLQPHPLPPQQLPLLPPLPQQPQTVRRFSRPMPGTILSVNVSVGSAVKAGEVILILEAMKMENEIVAPCDGTVKQLAVQKGSTVATDALLAVVG